MLNRGEGTTFEQLAHQDAQPDLNLVEPRTMLGRIVKDDAMGWVTQEGGPGLEVFQHPRFALDAQIDVQV